MPPNTTWTIVKPDVDAALRRFEFPLDELAAGAIPAIVLRGVFPATACRVLVNRLMAEDLLYDPHQPAPQRFRDESIPEGFFRKGKNSQPSYAWASSQKAAGRTRIDIGTSLGTRGSEKEAFLAHAAETHALFDQLFADSDSPIGVLYDQLEKLSRDKRVITAYEPDGRQYGPAIIRAHYGGYTYQPHFDSVRLREKRSNYAVNDFEHQFAGVLVLQNTQLNDRTAQSVLHHCLWGPQVDPHIQNGTFHDYANKRGIESTEVILNPGDLYFFNTHSIHEVPGVAGELPRIVLATFIGYSKDREEIFVWS